MSISCTAYAILLFEELTKQKDKIDFEELKKALEYLEDPFYFEADHHFYDPHCIFFWSIEQLEAMNIIKTFEEDGKKFIKITDRENIYRWADPSHRFEQILEGYGDFITYCMKEEAKRCLYSYIVEKVKKQCGKKFDFYSKARRMLEKAEMKVQNKLKNKCKYS